MDKKPLTTEELQNRVGQITAQLSSLFDNALGEDSYSCYVNIAWNKAIVGVPDAVQRICLVSTPEGPSGDSQYESIAELSKSLSSDPFLNHVIIYNFTNTLLSNFVPTDDITIKPLGKFKYTSSLEGVN